MPISLCGGMSAALALARSTLRAYRVAGVLVAVLACGAAACGGQEAYDLSGRYEYKIAINDSTLSCNYGGDSSGDLNLYTGSGDSLTGTFGMCGGGFLGAVEAGHLRGDEASFYIGGFLVDATVLPGSLFGKAQGYGRADFVFTAKRAGFNEGKSLP